MGLILDKPFDMEWLFFIFFGIAAIALIAFLAWRNQKDKKQLEDQLNNDYRKSKDEEDDAETEEAVK
jgi:FtsZ-interacting cell division protein ZipA